MIEYNNWNEYPIGSKVYSCSGGFWTKTDEGWQHVNGDTFPAPDNSATKALLPCGKVIFGGSSLISGINS